MADLLKRGADGTFRDFAVFGDGWRLRFRVEERPTP